MKGNSQSVDLNAMYQDEIPSVDHMLPTKQMTGKNTNETNQQQKYFNPKREKKGIM